MIYVIVPTRNGAETLPRTFERFLDLIPPEGGVSYLAVDNASSDSTPSILRSYVERLPLTCFHELTPGKNNGLNHVLRALRPTLAAAELVVFADDDILPDRDWLVRLQEAARAQPWANVFGGTITAVWPASKPDWIDDLAEVFSLLFSLTDHAEGSCDAGMIWGPNMAVRGKVLAGSICFDPKFGPDGSAEYPMGSETEFLIRLKAAGHGAYFAARARVGHIIRERQLTEAAVHQRAWRGGYGWALLVRNRLRWLKIGKRSLRLEFDLLCTKLKHRLSTTPARRRFLAFKLVWYQGAQAGFASDEQGALRSRNLDERKTASAPGDVSAQQ